MKYSLAKKYISVIITVLMLLGMPVSAAEEPTEAMATIWDFSLYTWAAGIEPPVGNNEILFNKFAPTGDMNAIMEEDKAAGHNYAKFYSSEKKSGKMETYTYKPVPEQYHRAILTTEVKTENKSGSVEFYATVPSKKVSLYTIENGSLYFMGSRVDTIRSGKWYEISIEFDFTEKTAAMYINGDKVATNPFTDTFSERTNAFRWIMEAAAGSPFGFGIGYIKMDAYYTEEKKTDEESSDTEYLNRIVLTDELEEIVDKTIENAKGVHPSLLFRQEDIPALKEKIKYGNAKKAFEAMSETVKVYMQDDPKNPPNYGATGGRGYQRDWAELILYGILTDEEAYIRQAIDTMCTVAESHNTQWYYDVNGGGLSTGDFSTAFAIGYDWAYNYMTDEERTLIKNELYELGKMGFEKSFTEYWGNEEFRRTVSNWCSVSHGGLSVAAIALADMEESRQWLRRGIMKINEYMHNSKDVTGEAYEGLSYMGYGMHYAIITAASVQRNTGIEMLDDIPTMRNAVNYYLWQTLPYGKGQLDITAANGDSHYGAIYYTIMRYKNGLGLWGWEKMHGFGGDSPMPSTPGWTGGCFQLPQIIIYDNADVKPVSPEECGVGDFMLFSRGHIVARDGWEGDSSLMSFSSGLGNAGSWNHTDNNHFLFIANGGFFVKDLGVGNNTAEHHNLPMMDGKTSSNPGGASASTGQITEYADYGEAVYAKGDGKQAFANLSWNRFDRSIVYGRGNTPYVFVYDNVYANDSEHTFRTNYYGSTYEKKNQRMFKLFSNDKTCYGLLYTDGATEILDPTIAGKVGFSVEVKQSELKSGMLLIAPKEGGYQPKMIKTGDGSGNMRIDIFLENGRHDCISIKDNELTFVSNCEDEIIMTDANGVISAENMKPNIMKDGTTYVNTEWLNGYTNGTVDVSIFGENTITTEDGVFVPIREFCEKMPEYNMSVRYSEKLDTVIIEKNGEKINEEENLHIDDIANWDYTEYPLKGIFANGEKIKGFHPDKREYYISAEGMEKVPEITVESDYETEIIQPEGASIVKIKVYSSDKSAFSEYTLSYGLEVQNGIEEGYSHIVPARIYDSTGGKAAGFDSLTLIDRDMSTAYSAAGDVWVEYDLGTSKTVDAVGLAFADGDKNKIPLKIEVSENGIDYAEVFAGETTGSWAGYEMIRIISCNARYVRYSGKGENKLCEMTVLTKD